MSAPATAEPGDLLRQAREEEAAAARAVEPPPYPGDAGQRSALALVQDNGRDPVQETLEACGFDLYLSGEQPDILRRMLHDLATAARQLDPLDRALLRAEATERLAHLRNAEALVAAAFGDGTDVETPANALHLLDDVEIEQVPEPAWAIEGLFPTDALVVPYGASEAAKTFLELDWALCIASGLPWRGRPVGRGPVAYVASEGWAGIKRRVLAWKRAHGMSGRVGVQFLAGGFNLLDAREAERLLTAVRTKIGRDPVLIVVDTLNQSMPGGDENHPKDMGLAVASLQLLRRSTGASVHAVHHCPREGERERGHLSLRNAADTMMLLAVADDGATRVLTCTKMRNGPYFEPIRFSLAPDGDSLVLADPPVEHAGPDRAPTPSEERALTVLRDIATNDGVSYSRWEQAAELKPRTFALAVKGLLEAGRISKGSRRNGRYTPTPDGERVPF